jgi:hypothetical protein
LNLWGFIKAIFTPLHQPTYFVKGTYTEPKDEGSTGSFSINPADKEKLRPSPTPGFVVVNSPTGYPQKGTLYPSTDPTVPSIFKVEGASLSVEQKG